MLSTKDVAIIYETPLTSPGMNDSMRIDLRMPRKNVLLLTKLIELGLELKDDTAQNGLLSAFTNDIVGKVKNITGDILRKAGLTETDNKLNSLQSK